MGQSIPFPWWILLTIVASVCVLTQFAVQPHRVQLYTPTDSQHSRRYPVLRCNDGSSGIFNPENIPSYIIEAWNDQIWRAHTNNETHVYLVILKDRLWKRLKRDAGVTDQMMDYVADLYNRAGWIVSSVYKFDGNNFKKDRWVLRERVPRLGNQNTKLPNCQRFIANCHRLIADNKLTSI